MKVSISRENKKNQSKYFLIITAFLFIISLNPILVSANTYYADLIFDLERDGSLSIDGSSNHPNFQRIEKSQDYTSKSGPLWTLEIQSEEEFAYYIFRLNLPQGIEVNNIETLNFKILGEENMVILGEGGQTPLYLNLKYTLREEELISNTLLNNYQKTFLILLLSILLFISIFYILRKFPINKAKKNSLLISPRQDEIMKIIYEREKITQKELEEMLEIPKSSISRNLKTLEIKNIIKRERVGNTKYIILKKPE